jgi:hypothetical protein
MPEARGLAGRTGKPTGDPRFHESAMIDRGKQTDSNGLLISELVVVPTSERQGGRRVWRLAADLSMTLDFSGGVFEICVPAGFRTDFASIPRPLWWLYPHDELAEIAVIHDWLYRETDMDRFFCDAVLRLLMRITGKRWSMRVAYFWAVRIGGWMGRTHKGFSL